MSKHVLAAAVRFNAAPVLGYIKEVIAYRAARAALSAMNDGELDDIGLMRCRSGFRRSPGDRWRPPCSP